MSGRSGVLAHVVVVSDRAARGERRDATGPRLIEELTSLGYGLATPPLSLVADDREEIAARLRDLVGNPRVRLVVTTGGTGAAPRDVTPEATREVIDRELPGFGELMRARSLARTALAAGSRAVSGTAGDTLVVNLPGSPQGAVECLRFIASPMGHVLDLIGGAAVDCAPPAP